MKICIVTCDLLELLHKNEDGGIFSGIVNELENHGNIEILYVDPSLLEPNIEFRIWKNELAKKSISMSRPTYVRKPFEYNHEYLHLSSVVYENLRGRNFDLILFPELNGLGYYSFLAKKLGLEFSKTQLATLYIGPSEWSDLHNNFLPEDYADLVHYYIEKESCLLSDQVFFMSQSAQRSAIELGYVGLKEPKQVVVPIPQIADSKYSKSKLSGKPYSQVCYWGKLETRKGLEIFLDAIYELSEEVDLEDIEVTLLGEAGEVGLQKCDEYIGEWLLKNNIKLNIISNLDFPSSVEYLKSKSTIVVLPAQAEVVAYNLNACLLNQISFICSDIDTHRELLVDLKLTGSSIFKSNNSTSLKQAIGRVLLKKPSSPYFASISSPKVKSKDKLAQTTWLSAVNKLIKSTPVKRVKAKAIKKVTACISYSERPKFMRQLLLSLEPVADLIGEVLVYVNRASTAESKQLLSELKKVKKIKLVYAEPEVSPGRARNHLAKLASSESILFIDDDNILDYDVFRRIISAHEVEWDIICGPLKRFFDNNYATSGKLLSAEQQKVQLENIVNGCWLPTGRDITLSITENRIGDCNFLVKKSLFKKVGGFNESLYFGEDQEFLVRAVHRGANYRLSPESFVYYRIHSTNLSKKNNYFIQSTRLSAIILKSIGNESLKNFFRHLKWLNYQKHLKDIWQIDSMTNLAVESKMNDSGIRSFANFEFLGKVLKNKFSLGDDNRVLEMKLDTLGESEFTDPALFDCEMRLILYTSRSVSLFIYDQQIEIKKGYSNILVPFKSNCLFRIRSNEVWSIYVVDVQKLESM